MTESLTTLTSRFPTRIHRLDIKNPDGSLLRQIDLLAPVDPDALLDDPIVEQRYKADNYLPYWPIIWPSGLMLATRILTAESSPPHPPQDSGLKTQDSPRAIDLGCGLGTTGIAAALRGWHVTFTDYDPEAIEFAGHNALRNGIPAERIRALHMDWRDPVKETFPWVLASDVLYERRLHPLLLSCIAKLLEKSPHAQAWVSDPQRTSAEDFPLHALEHGFKVETQNLEGENFAGGKQLGQLYILRWAK
ncbi:MAG TPA: methyltransferase [Phycisphaerae bacterium]|nr:methyltransferase [Phycisphaerae bacterium]